MRGRPALQEDPLRLQFPGNSLLNSQTVGFSVLSLFFPALWEAIVQDWPQGVGGRLRQGQVAIRRQCHHILGKTPSSLCAYLHPSPPPCHPSLQACHQPQGVFSEGITCLRREQRRWQSGKGVAILDSIPGTLDLHPPGAHSPTPACPRSWWLYYFCSFGGLSLLPSVAAKRMWLTQEGCLRGSLRPLRDKE